MPFENAERTFVVRGTEITPNDTLHRYREKISRITLDSMVQFVGLLDAKGTVLEINKVALDAVGINLSDVEGQPFWTTFWWQVSDEINTTLRESIARASRGEFVRWDTRIYGRAGGKETIIIDASLCPVTDDAGNVVFICAEGRNITEKKAQEREIAETPPGSSPPLERLQKREDATRVLVVDDNEDGAEMLAEALSMKGYETRVALDAPTALRVAAEFSPQMAFLDIGLPVIDGYELASLLREIPGLADLRLIAVTGYGQESDREKTRAAGFHYHIVKPVDLDALEAAVMTRA
jgi:PAS domain S-box-containing protein